MISKPHRRIKRLGIVLLVLVAMLLLTFSSAAARASRTFTGVIALVCLVGLILAFVMPNVRKYRPSILNGAFIVLFLFFLLLNVVLYFAYAPPLSFKSLSPALFPLHYTAATLDMPFYEYNVTLLNNATSGKSYDFISELQAYAWMMSSNQNSEFTCYSSPSGVSCQAPPESNLSCVESAYYVRMPVVQNNTANATKLWLNDTQLKQLLLDIGKHAGSSGTLLSRNGAAVMLPHVRSLTIGCNDVYS